MLRFSVFIPTLNAARWLERCLASIAEQQYAADAVEVLIVDGGSTDETRTIAARFGARVLENPHRVAHLAFGVCGREATGDLLVMFAGDNELVGPVWLRDVAELFTRHADLAAAWGRQVTTPLDPPVNGYYALIQNDPLSFFLNHNLGYYLSRARVEDVHGRQSFVFGAHAARPLIWGANGLVLRMSLVRHILLREGFVGDVDVFHQMLEEGPRTLAYLPELHIAHHHVSSVRHWVRKWQRNVGQDFLAHAQHRDTRWFADRLFLPKVALWALYAGTVVPATLHALLLWARSGDGRWLYHPLLSFLQATTYLRLAVGRRAGWQLLARFALHTNFRKAQGKV